MCPMTEQFTHGDPQNKRTTMICPGISSVIHDTRHSFFGGRFDTNKTSEQIGQNMRLQRDAVKHGAPEACRSMKP